jgi:hypothetical protein
MLFSRNPGAVDLPALDGLWHGRLLPGRFAVVGVGRRDKRDEAFRADVRAVGADGFLASAAATPRVAA